MRMSPRELLEQKKAEGRLPPGFDIEAALTSSKARPQFLPAGKAIPPEPPRAAQRSQQPALPRGRKDVAIAHRGGKPPVDLHAMAARITGLAGEGVAEAAAALEVLATRLDELTARIGQVQAGLTALEAVTATAAGRLQALNHIEPQVLPAPAEGVPVPDMWAPPEPEPEAEEKKPYFPTEVPMRPKANDPETQVA